MLYNQYGSTVIKQPDLEDNGSVPVTIQDQTTPVVIVPLHKKLGESTLAAEGTMDTFSMTLVSATGFVAGNLVVVSDTASSQVYFGTQIGAAVGNVIQVDRPIDFSFPIGSIITRNTINLAVDGSGTLQTFSLRSGVDPNLQLTVDVVRILITMFTDSPVDLSTFGDIAGGITYGVTIRRRDGNRVNICNVKTNGDIGGICYDLHVFDATNPQQGQHGLQARLTFGGQDKLGVVVRIAPDEDFEAIIRDNLSSIAIFNIIAEGSIVIP